MVYPHDTNVTTEAVLFECLTATVFGTKALFRFFDGRGSCHKRQKPQAPTPQAPVVNRQTRKVANSKGLNRNTNLT